MKKHTVFRGAATALITPLTDNGVDYDAFGKLIDWQIEQGINGLIIAGTTGEGATLTYQEHEECIRFAVERAAGRVPIIAGSGSNDTSRAITLSKFSCRAGADALLVVTPYYNKATQNGLIASYTAIADAVDRPIILYNVPSRTGVNIEPATYAALARHPNIVGIKEASGNFSKLAETVMLVGDAIDIYSGNDDQIVPILSLGGKGVISVLSNVAPRQTHDICQNFFDGNVAEAARMQLEAIPLIEALFCETNPIPVKEALNLMGKEVGGYRLPLVEMAPENKERLRRELKNYGLID